MTDQRYYPAAIADNCKGTVSPAVHPRQGDCTYLFANRRATRIKVLVHDWFGVLLAARRITQGKFHWPSIRHGAQMYLCP